MQLPSFTEKKWWDRNFEGLLIFQLITAQLCSWDCKALISPQYGFKKLPGKCIYQNRLQVAIGFLLSCLLDQDLLGYLLKVMLVARPCFSGDKNTLFGDNSLNETWLLKFRSTFVLLQLNISTLSCWISKILVCRIVNCGDFESNCTLLISGSSFHSSPTFYSNLPWPQRTLDNFLMQNSSFLIKA